jgi:hypothetical protein
VIERQVWLEFIRQIQAAVDSGRADGLAPAALVAVPVTRRSDDGEVQANMLGEPAIVAASHATPPQLVWALRNAADGVERGTIR